MRAINLLYLQIFSLIVQPTTTSTFSWSSEVDPLYETDENGNTVRVSSVPATLDLKKNKCDPRIHALFDVGFLFETSDGTQTRGPDSKLTHIANTCAGARKKDCRLTDDQVERLKTSFEDLHAKRRENVWGNNPPDKQKFAVCRHLRTDDAGCANATLYHLADLFKEDALLVWGKFHKDGDAAKRRHVFQGLTDLTELYLNHPGVAVFCQQPKDLTETELLKYSEDGYADRMVTPLTKTYTFKEIVTTFVNAEDGVPKVRFFPHWRTFHTASLTTADSILFDLVRLEEGSSAVKHEQDEDFKGTFYYRAATAYVRYVDRLNVMREMARTCLENTGHHFCFIYQQTHNTKKYLQNIRHAIQDTACAVLLKLNYWMKNLEETWPNLVSSAPFTPDNPPTYNGRVLAPWSIHETLLESLSNRINEKNKETLTKTMQCLNSKIKLESNCKRVAGDRSGHRSNVVCKAQNMLIKASKYVRNYRRKRVSIGDKDLVTYVNFLTMDNLEHTIKISTRRLESSAQRIEQALSSDIRSLGDDLQKYFTRVAGFQENKAKADNQYLMGRLTERQREWERECRALGAKVDELTKAAIIMMSGRLAIETGSLVFFVFSLDFSGGLDRVYDIYNSILNIVMANDVKEKFKELLAANLDVLNGFEENMKYIKRMDQKFSLTDEENPEVSDKRENEFLISYSGYTPQIQLSQIVLLGTKLEAYREKICGLLLAEKTGDVFGRLNLEYSSGYTACEDIQAEIAEYQQNLQDVYEFQFEIMESYASFMHASVSKTAAAEISESLVVADKVGSGSGSGQGEEQVNRFKSEIDYISVMLQLEKWTAFQDFCNLRKYVEGGVAPLGCNDVPNLLARELLSVNHKKCEVRSKYVDIPMTKKDGVENDLGYIKFKKLFNEKAFSFKIPDTQWLVDNGWITREDATAGSADPVIYLMNLKLIVPYDYSPEKTTVTVRGSLRGGNKLHPDSDESYELEPEFTISYQYVEGKDANQACATSSRKNPYSLCDHPVSRRLQPICYNTQSFDRTVDVNNLYPSIYSRWRFRVTGYGDVEDIPVPVKPEDMKLKALATYCIPTSAAKRSSFPPSAPNKCCTDNTYYSVADRRCVQCPDDSQPFLKGYYCGKLERKSRKIESESDSDSESESESESGGGE